MAQMSGGFVTPGKRLFDLALALVLGLVLAPVLLVLVAVVLLIDGHPVFYVSERMRAPETAFWLVKLRTMNPARGAANAGVSGGDKSTRITRTGRFLRRTRLDEIPQLWNVIRGDMSFVGPRPPLRRYVEAHPALYRRVLASRPGITGLATLVFHRHEEMMLAACRTPAETEAVYLRRSVERKARIDLIYQGNRNLCFDLALIVRTGLRVLPLQRKR